MRVRVQRIVLQPGGCASEPHGHLSDAAHLNGTTQRL